MRLMSPSNLTAWTFTKGRSKGTVNTTKLERDDIHRDEWSTHIRRTVSEMMAQEQIAKLEKLGWVRQ